MGISKSTRLLPLAGLRAVSHHISARLCNKSRIWDGRRRKCEEIDLVDPYTTPSTCRFRPLVPRQTALHRVLLASDPRPASRSHTAFFSPVAAPFCSQTAQLRLHVLIRIEQKESEWCIEYDGGTVRGHGDVVKAILAWDEEKVEELLYWVAVH